MPSGLMRNTLPDRFASVRAFAGNTGFAHTDVKLAVRAEKSSAPPLWLPFVDAMLLIRITSLLATRDARYWRRR